jgi:uncharacterized membrane protein YgcG
MLQIGIMLAIAAAIFWWLPIGVAAFVGIIVFFLIAAKLRDAANKGRHIMIARNDEDEAERIRNRDTTFMYAMWIGLTVAETTHADGGAYIHHPGGGDFGGDIGGGFDGGGGGGDGSGM